MNVILRAKYIETKSQVNKLLSEEQRKVLSALNAKQGKKLPYYYYIYTGETDYMAIHIIEKWDDGVFGFNKNCMEEQEYWQNIRWLLKQYKIID